MGHCCSYTILKELETEATFAATARNDICPENTTRSKNMGTGLAFDNFDRFMDTRTGKDTLHDTVGIIYHNIISSPHNTINEQSELIEETDDSSESSKKRRRSFDAITFEYDSYTKKPRYDETLQVVEQLNAP